MQQEVFSKEWWKTIFQLTESENNELFSNTVHDFMNFVNMELKINKPCSIEFTTDKTKTKTYGHYEPETNNIVIYIKDRGTADILRTLGHELIHRKQAELNLIKPGSGETGSPIENEANALAGVLLRKFGEINPMIYESLLLEEREAGFPSEEFSIKNRINVSKRWKFPEGYNEDRVQNICLNLEDPKNIEEYKKVAPLIFKLNPELRQIIVTENNKYWDILMGVASRFNLDDIKFFIEDWKWDTKEGNNLRQKLRNIEKKYDVDIQWIPSPKTTETIINHFTNLKGTTLNEIGDSKEIYKWNFLGKKDGALTYGFKTENYNYFVKFISHGSGTFERMYFHEPLEKYDYSKDYGDDNWTDKKGPYAPTGENQAIKVNSTVTNITLDFLERNKEWHDILITPIDPRRYKLVMAFLDKQLPDKYTLDNEGSNIIISRKIM